MRVEGARMQPDSRVTVAEGFYLPGVSPRTFKKDEPVRIKVQTLVSTESQLQFDYYQVPAAMLRHALSRRGLCAGTTVLN
jgi:hypothetical protein